MNKSQLVDALAARIGDRRTAATAVDGLLETIVTTVGTGESVSITGFGVFEARPRAARAARNPRTGASVEVPATTVPAFRAGAGFRSSVGGSPAAPPRRSATARRPAAAPPAPEVAPAAASAAVAVKRSSARADAPFATDAPPPKAAKAKGKATDKEKKPKKAKKK